MLEQPRIISQGASKDTCPNAAGVDSREATPTRGGETHVWCIVQHYAHVTASHLLTSNPPPHHTHPSLCLPLPQYLDCLWAQIQKLKKDRWQERHILRPYIAFDSVLCEALQHNLPPFTPPGHMPDAQYPMPRVVFRMFDYTDAPEVHCLRLVRPLSAFICFLLCRFQKDLLSSPSGSCDARQPFCGEICNRGKPALYHQDSLEREENMVGV